MITELKKLSSAKTTFNNRKTSDLSNPNSWKPVNMTQGNLDVGNDGTVGLNVKATGNAKFFKVVVPEK